MNDVPMPEMVPDLAGRLYTAGRRAGGYGEAIELAFRDGVLAERQRGAKTAAALDIATHAMQEAVSERLMSSGPLAAALAEMRRVLEDGER